MIPLPTITNVSRQNGYSLVEWVVTFAVVLAAVIFIRGSLKMGLENKIAATTDYMFWRSWGNSTQQYKGETNTFVKTQSNQSFNARGSERNKYINNNASSTAGENSVSSGVEEGSQPALKTFDLNNILH